MDHPVAGNVVSLDDVSHSKTVKILIRRFEARYFCWPAGDCHLAGKLGQGQPLSCPGYQGSAAFREPAGGKTTLGHVSQQGQLQLLSVGNHRLEISLVYNTVLR